MAPRSGKGNKRLITLGVLLVAGCIGIWFATNARPIPASSLRAHAPDLENGKRFFFAGGCASCHATPNQPDITRLGGGLTLDTVFGLFRVPNISSDPTDGIGRWSEAEFITAMVKGSSPDGRHYYPAFPYTSYQRMAWSDIRDMFAYLKTLPAVEGPVPDHELRFPLNIRRGVALWKLAFLDGKRFEPDPKQSEQWNRGSYLANGAGHCARCHSPHNFLGALVESERYAGGMSLEGKQEWIPNITQYALKDWSEKDFAYFLETGMTKSGDSAGGAMAAVIKNTSKLPAEDRAAMAVYLKSLPPIVGRKPAAAK